MRQKYCKHCGGMLAEHTTICAKCGFDGSRDNKFCGNCGAKVEQGQVVCVGCGYMLREISREERNGEVKPNKSDYKRFNSYVSKITSLTVFEYIIGVILALLMIFLPIYVCKYQPDLYDIDSLEQLGDVLINNGYLTKNFSVFDDIMIYVKWIDNRTDDFPAFFGLMNYFFALSECCLVAFQIVASFVKIGSKLGIDNDKETLLRYSEIKKTGRIGIKEKYSVPSFFLIMFIYALLDMVWDISFSSDLFGDANLPIRYMENVTGLSANIAIVVIGMVVLIVVRCIRKKEERSFILKVTEEDRI